ncbi:MAG: biopolymer transporter ExbD [Verrucomicrobiota bacterium]
MNFRKRAKPEVFGFQIAPMVDILLVLLVFFIVTWNFALSENELDVKIPSAQKAKEPQPYAGQVVINVRADGSIVLQHKTLTPQQLREKLSDLSKLFPDQAIILRGDQKADYKSIVDVLDICRMANIWNVAFATAKQE